MKMRICNNLVDSVHVSGDIHGEFTNLFGQIKMNKNLHDAAIIVAGDCGFGFEKSGYYTQLFDKWNPILNKLNSYVYFVRGNHDDPDYFNSESDKFELIQYSNIQTIEDYTVLTFDCFNILCVGGGISIDREFRRRNDEVNKRYAESVGSSYFAKSYWENEQVVYDEDRIIDDIDIFMVVSHSAPSFVFPQDKVGIEYWLKYDSELEKDIDEERAFLDKLYNKVKNNKFTHWYYGHFHGNHTEKYDNVIFTLCNCNTIVPIIQFNKDERLERT